MVDVLTLICAIAFTSPLVLFVVYTLYVFHQHARYSHIPGPKRTSFYLGNLPELRHWRETGTAVDLFFSWTLEHGTVLVFWVFHSPILIVSEPELLKKCVLTLNLPKADKAYKYLRYPFGIRTVGTGIVSETNHEEWKWKRAMLNQAFHRKHLMNLMKEFNNSCDIFLEKIGRLADGKTRVNMSAEFARVTLDIISKVNWVVPENIHTPTTGGIEILPPSHAFRNSKMLHPPCIRNSRLLPPPPPLSLSEFQRCFQPLQNFLFNLLTPRKSFFSTS